jgi:hypothetical protein
MRFLLAPSVFLLVMTAACNNSIPSSKTASDSGHHVNVADSPTTDSKVSSSLILMPEEPEGSLSVSVAASDTFDVESDMAYGVGDDDMFTANDMGVLKLSNGQYINAAHQLNDYNLTTAFSGHLANGQPDTFLLIINFPGLYGGKGDTAIIVNEIEIFNGNRKNLSAWKNNGAVRDVLVYNGYMLSGAAVLEHTFKSQTIDLSRCPIYNLRGNADTIRLLVNSIYANKKDSTYCLSEIKLWGKRMY